MSRPSWQDSLARMLAGPRSAERPLRVAVVGIGHDLRGDDAAGPALARALRPHAGDGLLVIDAGPAPEAYTATLRRFAPDLVLLVDAAQMDAAPGAIRWLPWQETSGLGASTHTLPPHVLGAFLTADLGCRVALLGIQPADTTIGADLSPAVREAVEAAAAGLAAAVGGEAIRSRPDAPRGTSCHDGRGR